jgi:hypothetical protein
MDKYVSFGSGRVGTVKQKLGDKAYYSEEEPSDD